PYASERDVDVWVTGIVVCDGDPLEIGFEILCHPKHQFTRKPRQIGAVTEFRGYDELPKQRITGRLPPLQFSCDINPFLLRGKARPLYIVFKCRGVAREIASVCSPLPRSGVLRIDHPDCAALRMLRSGSRFSDDLAPSCNGAAACKMQEQPKTFAHPPAFP